MSPLFLVGGGSSVGKTTVCQQVSHLLQCKHIQVDELQKEIDDPGVHQFSGNQLQWKRSAEDFTVQLVQVAEALEPYLRSMIQTWVDGGDHVLLEGEGIHPRLAAHFRDHKAIRSVFIIETNQAQLAQTLNRRSQIL